jgi:hypothetical protein
VNVVRGHGVAGETVPFGAYEGEVTGAGDVGDDEEGVELGLGAAIPDKGVAGVGLCVGPGVAGNCADRVVGSTAAYGDLARGRRRREDGEARVGRMEEVVGRSK